MKRRTKKPSKTSPLLKMMVIGAVFTVALLLGLSTHIETIIKAFSQTPAATPQAIQLGFFYKPPTNMTTAQLAQKVGALVLTRKDEAAVQEAKAAGFQKPILQYLIFDSIQGPSNLTNNIVGACTPTQKAFAPRSNQVANEVGEFCQVHDSIVTGALFDHDLNPTTPAVAATETWFLHNSAGQRLGNNGGSGFYYHLNHGQPQVREYFLARVLRELNGSASHPATGMDGVFFDNVELSWTKKLTQLDITGQPIEFSSSTSFSNAVYDSLASMSTALHATSKPVWANLVENPELGDDWARYAAVLDGAMEESFALDWDGRPRSASNFERQLIQTEGWLAQNRALLTVSQGTNNATQARYGLASFLLITDGTRSYYRHGDSSSYSEMWLYPEYELQLGQPMGPRYRDTSSTQVIWKRDFSCGQVSVNVTAGTASITPTSCATPSPTPSITPTATPIVSPSPSPVSTPRPKPTKKPGR